MERWIGKVAIVTGVSSGIGLSIATQLVRSGMIVIGLARRLDRMEQLKSNLSMEKGELYPYVCDLSKLESIKITFQEITKKFPNINILINNAGIGKYTQLLSENNEIDLKSIIDTNLMSYIYCIKECYKLMKITNEESVIININSILGHSIPYSLLTNCYNIYPASKHALKAINEVLQQELIENRNIRICSISPGLVKTEIFEAANYPNADGIMNTEAILLPEDIAKSIMFILEMPKHVQIADIIIKAVGEKF